MARRTVAFLVFPGFQLLDLAGPLDVFDAAARLCSRAGGGYRCEVFSRGGGPVRSASGVSVATRPARRAGGAVDTWVVVGGPGVQEALADGRVAAAIRRLGRRPRRLASVCNGALLLASAGLLDGRRAATHWAWTLALARDFPGVAVDPSSIFVQDGRIWSSAGVTAGIDLALAMVEEDHGSSLALEVARWLVLFLKRPGGQAQFSVQLGNQLAQRRPLQELQAWIAERPAADLSVTALARRVAMSPRNFARVFAREVGVTPARYVEQARVEAARRALETTGAPVAAIAADHGFGTPETLERAFRRCLGVTPRAYRERFGARPRA